MIDLDLLLFFLVDLVVCRACTSGVPVTICVRATIAVLLMQPSQELPRQHREILRPLEPFPVIKTWLCVVGLAALVARVFLDSA